MNEHKQLDSRRVKSLSLKIGAYVEKEINKAIVELVNKGALTSIDLPKVEESSLELASLAGAIVRSKLEVLIRKEFGLLRLNPSVGFITIPSTSGTRNFSNSSECFSSIQPKPGPKNPEKATGETRVEVLKLFKDGNLSQIFSGIREDMDSLCLTEHQIISLLEELPEDMRKDSVNMMLFKQDHVYMVADLRLDLASKPVLYIHSLSLVHIWQKSANLNVVVPVHAF